MSKTDSPKKDESFPQSSFQSKIELQMMGQQYGWLQNKMQYELKLLLSDWLRLSQKSQDGKCDRCMAPLTLENIDDSTVGTFVHLTCPAEQSSFVKSRIARYLKRHGVA